jgi:hypothetical protein
MPEHPGCKLNQTISGRAGKAREIVAVLHGKPPEKIG